MHVRKDAPAGFKYRRKNTVDDCASTIFLGEGVSIDDYELITDEEYAAIMEAQNAETI